MVAGCGAKEGADGRCGCIKEVGDSDEEGGWVGGCVVCVGCEEDGAEEVVLEFARDGFDEEFGVGGCEERLWRQIG